ncbi:hypothetical protein GQ457_06G037820 [Hibiscus cannabinus]
MISEKLMFQNMLHVTNDPQIQTLASTNQNSFMYVFFPLCRAAVYNLNWLKWSGERGDIDTFVNCLKSAVPSSPAKVALHKFKGREGNLAIFHLCLSVWGDKSFYGLWQSFFVVFWITNWVPLSKTCS